MLYKKPRDRHSVANVRIVSAKTTSVYDGVMQMTPEVKSEDFHWMERGKFYQLNCNILSYQGKMHSLRNTENIVDTNLNKL